MTKPLHRATKCDRQSHMLPCGLSNGRASALVVGMIKTTGAAIAASVALGLIVAACGGQEASTPKAPSSSSADGGTKAPEKAEHVVHEHDH